jgi:hypothetical protein
MAVTLWILGAVLALAALALVVVMARSPRADRPWAEHLARAASASLHPDGTVTIHNLRDWIYAGGAVTRTWRDEAVDPGKITGASFLIEPFGGWAALAHTFLSFRLEDGSAISFSIEARLEDGQPFSALRGAFRNYELAYQWGTERDFVTRRVVYLRHPLRLYPLIIDADAARRLFIDLVKETNALAERPRFYNTLAENCTNTLAYIVNRYAPHTLPWSLDWYFTGFADEYLMKHGYIALDGGSIEGTKALHDLGSQRAAVKAMAASPPAAFSTEIRRLAHAA